MLKFGFTNLMVYSHAKRGVRRMWHKLSSDGLEKELDVLIRDLRRLNMKMRELDAAIKE